MIIYAAEARADIQGLVGLPSLLFLATRKPRRPVPRGKGKAIALLSASLMVQVVAQILIIAGLSPALPTNVAAEFIASPLLFTAIATVPHIRQVRAGVDPTAAPSPATMWIPALEGALFCWPLFAAFYISMVETRLTPMLVIFVVSYSLLFMVLYFALGWSGASEKA